MVFIEMDWSQRIRERKSLFKVPICSTSISEAIIYKSFGITYYFIHELTNMEEMARKKKWALFKHLKKFKQFKKFISL